MGDNALKIGFLNESWAEGCSPTGHSDSKKYFHGTDKLQYALRLPDEKGIYKWEQQYYSFHSRVDTLLKTMKWSVANPRGMVGYESSSR